MIQKIVFGRPVADLIRQRHSCRSFDGRGLEVKLLDELEEFPGGLELPFGNQPRFGIIDSEQVRSQNLFSTGSYGMIKGVRFYLAALVRRGEPRRWEDSGFALEAAVLHATGLGLGSCWIGGVFDRRRFGRILEIRADEQLPAVIAIGRQASKKTLRDRLVRWSAGGDRRKATSELFFMGGWRAPWPDAVEARWTKVLECVRLAPSASNKQPWRIILADGAFHFFLNRDKAYSALMPKADLQRIDMGIAMCHFQLAAAEFGLDGEWRISEPALPDTPANYEYVITFVVHQP